MDFMGSLSFKTLFTIQFFSTKVPKKVLRTMRIQTRHKLLFTASELRETFLPFFICFLGERGVQRRKGVVGHEWDKKKEKIISLSSLSMNTA